MASFIAHQVLEEALVHHREGRLKEAEHYYRQILEIHPNNAYILNLAAIAAGQDGRAGEAIVLLRRAISVHPDVADYHANLAKFLRDAGEIEPSIASCRRALELNPKHVDALNNLGIAMRATGDVDGAIETYHAALKIIPDHVEVCNNLGTALRDKGLKHEAVASYRQAVSLRPKYAEAHSNLSAALRDIGRFEEAIGAAERAVGLNPNLVHAWNNLGNALRDFERPDDAIAAYQRALEIDPGFAVAVNNLGISLFDAHRLDESIKISLQAQRLIPDSADPSNNLGNALKDQGRIEEAIEHYRRAAAIRPDVSIPLSNLAYGLYFHPAFDSAAILAEHRRWEQIHAQPLKDQIRPHGNDRTLSRRLRVGYVSPDFRDHVVGRNLLPLLQNHDASAVEVFCYADLHRPDALTPDFQRAAHYWQNICGLSDADLAEKVRADQIDILLDLSLHMAGNRLLCFARKPAPIQATFAGYPGTTGLSAIDYRLTDPHLDPPGEFDADYAEKSIRLTDTFWCYQACACTPAVNPPPAATKGYITFGCLNNFCKINDAVLNLWAAVLSAVANSRLLLLAWPGEHRVDLQNKMQGMGIAAERIQFAAPCPLEQYLSLYHQIDIGLDTFPYNGHTTSLDSYYMGVPVITVAGRTVVGRAGLSQLTNLKLTRLIAGSPQDYVRIAKSLAEDLDQLKQLRATLRERMEASPLMDAQRFARSVEAAYRQMWGSWCASGKLHEITPSYP